MMSLAWPAALLAVWVALLAVCCAVPAALLAVCLAVPVAEPAACLALAAALLATSLAESRVSSAYWAVLPAACRCEKAVSSAS